VPRLDASAAYRADKSLVGTFEANLTTLPEAQGDPKTMAWWQTQPEAWAVCRRNPREPAEVMPQYVAWLKALPGKPVFVGYPAAYDFLFVYWYLIRFAGESPFALGPRHQDVRDGNSRYRIPRLGETEHAARMVRRLAAHARRSGRREGPGGIILQHVEGRPSAAPIAFRVVIDGCARRHHDPSQHRDRAREPAVAPIEHIHDPSAVSVFPLPSSASLGRGSR
jgi:hypothetical protein